MDHCLRGVGQRPHPWPAVQGAFHPHGGTVVGRGHREVSRLRHDPGHRPGLRPQAGAGVWREGVRCHRGRAGTAARGGRHRPKVRAKRITDAWAEQKVVREIMVFLHSHGVGTARAVRIFRTYGADAVEVMTENPYRLARDIRGIGFSDRRRDRDEARDREDGHGPRARGHRLRADRSDGRGALRLPGEELGPLAAKPPGGSRRADPNRAGPGAGRRHGGCRHGGGDPLHIPRRPAPGRTRDRRASSGDRGRQSPMARHRSGQGPALGGGQDRARPGARPGRCGARGALLEGLRHHRRTGRRQDDDRQLDPAHPVRQGRRYPAVRADRARGQADERGHRVGGEDDPPPARGRPQELAGSGAIRRTRSNAACW